MQCLHYRKTNTCVSISKDSRTLWCKTVKVGLNQCCKKCITEKCNTLLYITLGNTAITSSKQDSLKFDMRQQSLLRKSMFFKIKLFTWDLKDQCSNLVLTSVLKWSQETYSGHILMSGVNRKNLTLSTYGHVLFPVRAHSWCLLIQLYFQASLSVKPVFGLSDLSYCRNNSSMVGNCNRYGYEGLIMR